MLKGRFFLEISGCPDRTVRWFGSPMAVTVRWRFHDVSTSAAAGKFIDFHSLETIFRKAEESKRKRLVMMSVRVEDKGEGKGSPGQPNQELKELGPVLMRDAIAHLLQEMVDTNDLDMQMRTAVLLAEHECWSYKPLGKVRGAKSLLVLKNLVTVLLLLVVFHAVAVCECGRQTLIRHEQMIHHMVVNEYRFIYRLF